MHLAHHTWIAMLTPQGSGWLGSGTAHAKLESIVCLQLIGNQKHPVPNLLSKARAELRQNTVYILYSWWFQSPITKTIQLALIIPGGS